MSRLPGYGRAQLDGFDDFDPFEPPDIKTGEYFCLCDMWSELGGRNWKRGEKWRYADAAEWEGVTVLGGEMITRVPEERLVRNLAMKDATFREPFKRRGEPRFERGESVLVKSRVEPGGLATWVGPSSGGPASDQRGGGGGDPLRPATVLEVAVRGRGVKQEVEYELRFTDGVVAALDLGVNNLRGKLLEVALGPAGALRTSTSFVSNSSSSSLSSSSSSDGSTGANNDSTLSAAPSPTGEGQPQDAEEKCESSPAIAKELQLPLLSASSSSTAAAAAAAASSGAKKSLKRPKGRGSLARRRSVGTPSSSGSSSGARGGGGGSRRGGGVSTLSLSLTHTLRHLVVLRLHGNALGGVVDVELLRAKARGTMEVRLEGCDPGFLLPVDFHRVADPATHFPVDSLPPYALPPTFATSPAAPDHPGPSFLKGGAYSSAAPFSDTRASRTVNTFGSSAALAQPPPPTWRGQSAGQSAGVVGGGGGALVPHHSRLLAASSSSSSSSSPASSFRAGAAATSGACTGSSTGFVGGSTGSTGGGGGLRSSGGFDPWHVQFELRGSDDPTMHAPLASLDLSRCSLHGQLIEAPGLAQLTSLTTLCLDDNKFSGPLPAESLTKLGQLQRLSLERNSLCGPLPALLCRLHRSLRVLKLSYNQLEGPLPPEWVQMQGLTELSLGGNRLVDSLRDGWIADRLPTCLVTF